MRLHHLQVSAFGPFAASVAVDLDRLSSAGLFLLSGPTGAGKTSILDAVCFALYGDVPGDRSSAKRLRCDQAPPGATPRVVLEATLAGRRFRISRSPAWERPKKRGDGTTTEQASVVVEERRAGEWTALTTRLDEAGHLITDLLGMTLTQFTQVALLPQGRFQSFLRAKSEERKALLQRLFRTERFTDIERWLREHRIALRRRSEGVNQRIADALSRISEATETPLPDAWDLGDLSLAAADGDLVGWADEIEKRLHDDHLESCRAAGDAVAAEAGAREALEQARSFAEARERLDAATTEHAALVAEADEVALIAERVEAARRAAVVTPVLTMVTRARAQYDACSAVAPEDAVLAEAVAAHREQLRAIDAARALLPQEQRRDRLAAELARLRTTHERLAEEVSRLDQAAGHAPVRLEALRGQVTAAREAAAQVDTLRSRVRAWAEIDRLVVELAQAKEAHTLARETTFALRERALEVRSARLESMAAELAGALAVGACCPVCGSEEHPHKAAPAAETPDAEDEKAAQKAVDDATFDEQLRGLKVQELETRLALTREQAGPDDERESVTAELARVEALGATAAGAEAELAAATTEVERQARRLTEASAEAASAHTAAEALARELADLEEVLDEAVAGSDVRSVSSLLEARERSARSGAALVECLEARDRAAATLAEAEQALADALAQAAFDAAEAAQDAALDARAIEELTAHLKHHERRMAVVGAILNQPGAEELAARPLPDLAALSSAHEVALEAMSRAQAAVATGATALARLAELRDELDRALADWGPLRDALATATHLAAFAEGKSADNQLQMSLSAYVVAYRLTQVVDAANERLVTMTDQRYRLEHTATRAAGDRRGGLALLVRDEWSGETRDPATLSGGETFVVSLALALGLADVISQEAGGAMLETLFVDEGFGSLDAETLDDVMTVLDGLREGGRVVGVVSHVAELRDRIATQLLVSKSRTGSTVSLR